MAEYLRDENGNFYVEEDEKFLIVPEKEEDTEVWDYYRYFRENNLIPGQYSIFIVNDQSNSVLSFSNKTKWAIYGGSDGHTKLEEDTKGANAFVKFWHIKDYYVTKKGKKLLCIIASNGLYAQSSDNTPVFPVILAGSSSQPILLGYNARTPWLRYCIIGNPTFTSLNDNHFFDSSKAEYPVLRKWSDDTQEVTNLWQRWSYAWYNSNINNEFVKNCIAPNLTWETGFNYFMYGCKNVTELIFPGLKEVAGSYAFSQCNNVNKVELPSLVSIGGNAFSYIYNLKEIDLSAPTFTSITGSNNFNYCPALKWYKMGEVLPSLSSKNNFLYRTTDSIYGKRCFAIPYDTYSSNKALTNWTTFASQMRGYGTFENGAVLPTQTSDGLWNLKWFATKEELIWEKLDNPITVGNGKEIYCTYTEV